MKTWKLYIKNSLYFLQKGNSLNFQKPIVWIISVAPQHIKIKLLTLISKIVFLLFLNCNWNLHYILENCTSITWKEIYNLKYYLFRKYKLNSESHLTVLILWNILLTLSWMKKINCKAILLNQCEDFCIRDSCIMFWEQKTNTTFFGGAND